MRRSKLMAWILSMVMAFTIFGTTGTTVFATEQPPDGDVMTEEELAPEEAIADEIDAEGNLQTAGTMTGTGTEEDPFIVEDAEDFAAMSAEADTYYELAKDISVSAPYANEFAGNFDGAGHTITLNIEDTTANTGLFKTLVAGATVEGVTTKGSVTSSANYVGSIAGKAIGGEDDVFISDCHNEAAVTGAKGNAGGLVGWACNGVNIDDCSNSGTVNGSSNKVGGIVGYNSAGNVDIDQCVNNGAVNGTNNQIGGIVGNVSGGTTVISDTYNTGAITGTGQYSNMLGGIVGQATKTGPTDTLINCYNVGPCSFSQSTNTSIGALVGNKSNNGTTTNCYFLDTSASVAVGGTEAVGATAKTSDEMKADAFIEALNGDEGDSFVKDTNGINNGYPILTWQADGGIVEPDPADVEIVEALVTKFNGELGALRPACGTDTNIADFVKAKVQSYTGIEDFDPSEVSVALKSTDEPDVIGADGTISYIKRDQLNAYIYSVNAACVFTITYGTASADTGSRNATIGWDRAAFHEKMQAEADGLTEDTIKGSNASLSEVTEQLSLPQIMGTSAQKVWSTIAWTSSNEDVIHFESEQYAGVTKPLKGIVTPAEEDATVTLTATFSANESILNSNVEKPADFETIEKTFTVTVPGTGPVGPTAEELQEMLDKYYTADLFKCAEDQSPLDAENVTGDIQLPLYTRIKDENGELVFENKEITVTSSNTDVITINGYRAVVDRFQDENKTVDLVVSFTRNNITVNKTFSFKVIAITDADLDKEIAALNTVKEHYFDGINDGAYADKDSVTGNLHAFQEANVGEDGNITWVYDVNDKTNAGIIPDGYFDDPVQMEAAGYNRFKSSNTALVAHENLVVTMPEENTEVTITSWLSSEKYGKFAATHPDNEKLQKLFRQEVSVTITLKVASTPAAVGTVLQDPTGTYTVTSSDEASPEVTLTKGAAKATVSIPETITADGVTYLVTAIAPKAFLKNAKIKKVVVGPNIKTIGAMAFAKCKKLSSFTVGANVEKIGASCFSKSKKLKKLVVKSKLLKKSGVKKSLKGSKITVVKVKVGTKAQNKKTIKAYKKIFTKKNAGKKVKVK